MAQYVRENTLGLLCISKCERDGLLYISICERDGLTTRHKITLSTELLFPIFWREELHCGYIVVTLWLHCGLHYIKVQ